MKRTNTGTQQRQRVFDNLSHEDYEEIDNETKWINKTLVCREKNLSSSKRKIQIMSQLDGKKKAKGFLEKIDPRALKFQTSLRWCQIARREENKSKKHYGTLSKRFLPFDEVVRKLRSEMIRRVKSS